MVRPLLARVLKVAGPDQIVLSTDLHDDAQAYRLVCDIARTRNVSIGYFVDVNEGKFSCFVSTLFLHDWCSRVCLE